MVCYLQDLLEYRKKMRTLKVRMLDGTVKTMLVDDSQPVTNLMVVICTKIGKRVFFLGYSSLFQLYERFENVSEVIFQKEY